MARSGGIEHVGGIEQRSGRLLPQIAMVGQVEIIEAEGGHQRGVVGGDEVRVVAQVRIGGRQMLGVVVGGGGGGAVGVVDQGALQFVGNHAEFVAAHVQQRIHAGFDANAVGRGDEFAVGDEAQLVGMGDDPLRVGGGDDRQPSHSTRVPRCAVSLSWRAVSSGLSSAGCAPSRSFAVQSSGR